jgi:curli biogenesis system outer membrane secretion channel CsgG
VKTLMILLLTAALTATAQQQTTPTNTYVALPLTVENANSYAVTKNVANSTTYTSKVYEFEYMDSSAVNGGIAYVVATGADSLVAAVKIQFGHNGIFHPVSHTDSLKRRGTGGIAQATTAGDSLVTGSHLFFRRNVVCPPCSQVKFTVAFGTGNATDNNDAGALNPYPFTVGIVRTDPKPGGKK